MQDRTARTVTLRTIDHGDITIPEPAWCAGHPSPDPEHRIDISHVGKTHPFNLHTSRGPITAMLATVEQRPFIGDRFPGTDTFVNVEICGDWYPSDPQQLQELAAALVVHATHLRTLARELSALKAGEGR